MRESKKDPPKKVEPVIKLDSFGKSASPDKHEPAGQRKSDQKLGKPGGQAPTALVHVVERVPLGAMLGACWALNELSWATLALCCNISATKCDPSLH